MLKPTVPLNDGTKRIALPDYLNVEHDLRCSTKVTSKVFRNFQQYDDYRKSSAQFASSETVTVTTGILFWKSKFSAAATQAENSESAKMKKFFQETNGEVYISEASCQTYTMKVRPSVHLNFTKGFENQLRFLHYASKLPIGNRTANTLFKKFVEHYGTFYVSSVSMGAKLWIESRFTDQALSRTNIANRMKCVRSSFSSSAEASFAGPDIKITLGAEKGPVSGSAEFTVPTFDFSFSKGQGSASADCSASSSSSQYFNQNSMQQTQVFSLGSRPTNLKEWSKSEFKPVPIAYSLEPMTNLFDPYWSIVFPGGNLGNIPFAVNQKDGEKLDPKRIRQFFEKKLEEYCQIILDKQNCPVVETKGCGLNSFCGLDKNNCVTTSTTCINDKDTDVGYTCSCLIFTTPEKEQSLRDASKYVDIDKVKDLLESGTDFNADDSDQRTALFYAGNLKHFW
jgi:hypothetical protein